MSNELKACGSCGGTVEVARQEISWRVQYRVACACGICSKWFKTRKAATAAWNRRVVTREQVEKMARHASWQDGATWEYVSQVYIAKAEMMLRAAGFEVAE